MEIKNLAMSDSKGHDLEKDIAVRVTSVESKQVRNLSASDLITDKAPPPSLLGYARHIRAARRMRTANRLFLRVQKKVGLQKGMCRILDCQLVFDTDVSRCGLQTYN